jgi:1,4-alpha-glucan branching enzyme
MNLFEQILPRAVLLIDMIKIAKNSKSESAKASSPATNLVSLELVKPGAKTVCVAGSFNEWRPEKTPLVPLGNGRWAGDLTVKPGRHEYLFVVDGQWLPDPNATENVQNPYGGKNSVLLV